MTPLQFLAVVLRLFAVWLVFQALRTLPALFVVGAPMAPGTAYYAFLFGLSGVVALVLWFFPSIIARKLLPRSEPTPELSSTADTWLAIGCTLIGIWTLTSTIPRLVFDVLEITSAAAYDDLSKMHHWFVSNLLESTIAVWLLLGGKGLRKVFWWAQNAGTRKIP